MIPDAELDEEVIPVDPQDDFEDDDFDKADEGASPDACGF